MLKHPLTRLQYVYGTGSTDESVSIVGISESPKKLNGVSLKSCNAGSGYNPTPSSLLKSVV